ncbi:MAG: hypothetical protein IKB98_09780 [Clostridia bacterium]|nr:hypothetical protein [Clostridia bacterium]
MKRLLNSEDIKLININIDEELVGSFNKEHCVSDKTKVIIVGTITPPKGCGYFYTSPYNCIYGYIDETRKTNLKELKRKLKTDPTIKSDIIKILKEERIAFLDIMKEAIRKKDSSADNDIKNFSLDYDIFEEVFTNILKNNNVKVICNSRLAEEGYKRIKEELKNKIILPDNIYISQVRRLQKIWKEKWLIEI